jgi:hypothetical protein
MTKQEILDYIEKRYKGDKKAFYKDHPTMDIESVKRASDSFYKKEKYKKGVRAVGKYASGAQDMGRYNEFGYLKYDNPATNRTSNIMEGVAQAQSLGIGQTIGEMSGIPGAKLAGAALDFGGGMLVGQMKNKNAAHQTLVQEASNRAVDELKYDDKQYQALVRNGLDMTRSQKATDYNVEDTGTDSSVEITDMKNKYQDGSQFYQKNNISLMK